MEKNKFAKSTVIINDENVVVEFALIDDIKKKKWIVAKLEHKDLVITDKTIGDISQQIVELAIKKLDYEISQEDIDALDKITKQIESSGSND